LPQAFNGNRGGAERACETGTGGIEDGADSPDDPLLLEASYTPKKIILIGARPLRQYPVWFYCQREFTLQHVQDLSVRFIHSGDPFRFEGATSSMKPQK